MNSEKLKIAVLGGTGNIGEGMVLRLALQNLMAEGLKNEIIIGSRSREAAEEAAKQALSELENCGFDTSGIEITGNSNLEAAQAAEIIILTIRFDYVLPLLNELREALENKILITPVVPMVKEGDFFIYINLRRRFSRSCDSEKCPGFYKSCCSFPQYPGREIEGYSQVQGCIPCSGVQ